MRESIRSRLSDLNKALTSSTTSNTRVISERERLAQRSTNNQDDEKKKLSEIKERLDKLRREKDTTAGSKDSSGEAGSISKPESLTVTRLKDLQRAINEKGESSEASSFLLSLADQAKPQDSSKTRLDDLNEALDQPVIRNSSYDILPVPTQQKRETIESQTLKKGMVIGGLVLSAGITTIVTLFCLGIIQEAAARYEGGNLDKIMNRLAKIGSFRHRRSKKYFLCTSDGVLVHPVNLWNNCQFYHRLKVNDSYMKVIDFDMYKDRFEIELDGIEGVLTLKDVTSPEAAPSIYLFEDEFGRTYRIEIGETLVEVSK